MTTEICTNLNEAVAGQWVKVGDTKRGVTAVQQIRKVWKDRRIAMDRGDVYRPERDGKSAHRQGENGYRMAYSKLWAFEAGETVEGVLAAVRQREAKARAEAQAEAAAREAATQAAIAQARIVFNDSRDLPGVRIARWTDRNGQPRTTLFRGKAEPWLGETYYSAQISDYKDGTFGSSTCSSNVSVEDAVSRWIAAWW